MDTPAQHPCHSPGSVWTLHGEAAEFLTEQHFCCRISLAFRTFLTLRPNGPHTVYRWVKPCPWSNTGKLSHGIALHVLEDGAHVTAFPRLYVTSSFKNPPTFYFQQFRTYRKVESVIKKTLYTISVPLLVVNKGFIFLSVYTLLWLDCILKFICWDPNSNMMVEMWPLERDRFRWGHEGGSPWWD